MKYFILFSCLFFSALVHARQATNIIFLIGDGMGAAYTSAYRYYIDDASTPEVEATIFDELLVGMARTYPNDNTIVTDSAAAATALASGVKTFNGAIGVDLQKKPVASLLELAKAQGYRTAILATSSINHATPASFVAHVDSRQSYDQIADQYIDQRINGNYKVDLLLGGGRQFFVRKDRNLVRELQAAGYEYVADLNELDNLTKLPALGLFAEDGLDFALDSSHSARLKKMTAKALSLLDGKPFFLLVEASQMDWCGHANDIACAMAEMQDTAETLQLLKHYVDEHPNTILLATADHSTGGLSLGAGSHYRWEAKVIKKIHATAGRIAEVLISNNENWKVNWRQLTSIKLTVQEVQEMQQLMDKAGQLNKKNTNKKMQGAVKDGVVALTLTVINNRSYTGWTTTGHTGEDVQIFSYGKGREVFSGSLNNTDIAKRLIQYLPATQPGRVN